MRTILIAHRDADFADELATELRGWGYRVIECPGPLPPALRCIRCDKGYCPLTEGAEAGTLSAIHVATPWVHVAARDPRALRSQLHDLLPTAAVTP